MVLQSLIDLSFNNVSQTIGGQLVKHYFANLGITIPLNQSISLTPSLMFRYEISNDNHRIVVGIRFGKEELKSL